MTWGREDEPDVAVERLLDAAGRVFAERGVLSTRVADVAAAAGCSRGTVYRYFPDGDTLRLAFVNREAARVGVRVGSRIEGVREPDQRLVAAIEAALAEVRADPILSAWFTPESATAAGLVAVRAEVVAGLVDAFLAALFADADIRGDLRPRVRRELATDWVVRVVLSLLAQPAADERRLLEDLLAPALFAPAPARR